MDYRVAPASGRGARRLAGIDERTVSGMDFLLRRLDDEAGEDADELSGEPIQIDNISDPELGSILIQAVPLPKELPGWLSVRRNRMRVYHAVNGQVQFKQTRGFLSECRLPGLKDRVVILVDASEMTESAHNDIWKGDREAIRQTSVGNMYLATIRDSIRSSNAMKELQRRLAAEEVEQAAEQAQTDLFQSIVQTDPNIAQLLPGGTIVRLRQGPRGDGDGGQEWQGQYHPTFVRHRSASLRDHGVEVESEDRRRVQFVTDAENGWTTRPDNRGTITLEGDGADLFGIKASLLNGNLTVTVRPVPTEAVVGTTATLQLVLRDDGMAIPQTETVEVRVVAQRPHSPPGPPTPRPQSPGPGEEDGGEGRRLPDWRWLTRDGRALSGTPSEPWREGFTDQDGGLVEELSEDEMIYKINYDNAHFRSFLDRERSDAAKRVVTEQYKISMLVLMMGFEQACASMSDSDQQSELREFIDEFRLLAAQGAATVVMSIAKTLPQLITPDTVGDPDDD